MITPSAALIIETVSRAEKRTRSRASSNCDALEKTCVNAMAKIKDTRTLTCWNICRRFRPAQISRAHVLLHGEQLLEAGTIADRVPHWIDFQARDGNGLARRDREKFFQILHRFRR